ncbi:MAG: hypothetical protein JW993_05680 [Sedimentisphaerales bacterium]|nr:hypothetical protein [Sedimentisphaerales bacterium]
MSLVEVNWNPDRKGLNGFRLASLAATLIIATLLYTLKGVDIKWCAAIVGVGVLIWLSGLVSLRLTRYIYVVMTALTLPIGFVVSLLLMSVFYFGLITPIGLVFRLIGRDVLHRRFDRDAPSHWVDHRQTADMERYFQRF